MAGISTPEFLSASTFCLPLPKRDSLILLLSALVPAALLLAWMLPALSPRDPSSPIWYTALNSHIGEINFLIVPVHQPQASSIVHRTWTGDSFHTWYFTCFNAILPSRDITLPTKVCLIKAMVFPVVMYGCESWTIKKAECQIIDAFELWCWRRLLRVPWTARKSNQLILKEINHEYSLEVLMLKLKLHYFAHLMWRTDSLEKTLMLGRIEGRRRRGWQRMRWLDGITDAMDMSLYML